MTKRELRRWRKKVRRKKALDLKNKLRDRICENCAYYFSDESFTGRMIEECRTVGKKKKDIPVKRTCKDFKEINMGEWWTSN